MWCHKEKVKRTKNTYQQLETHHIQNDSIMKDIQIPQDKLTQLHDIYANKFEEIKAKKLSLDMTRGKPGSEQLDLSNALDGILEKSFKTADAVDARNYGGLDGIPEAKSLFAPVLGVEEDEILVGGNSSLTLMYQYTDHAFHHGTDGKESAWQNIKTPSFICPVPGYDRHFGICEFFGMKMIPVPIGEEGPDLEIIKELIQNDDSICGMWSVPKYTNPGGVVYSDKTISGLVEILKSSRKDFRLLWDNAYALHDLVENAPEISPILTQAKAAGIEDKVVLFGSTSKISFAGAGVSFAGMSKKNLKAFTTYLSFQTIGPDKVNQLRHVKFFKDTAGLKEHMKKHREILVPKFNEVLASLESEFSEYPFLTWNKPKGGYFISVDTLPGLANEVVKLSGEMGVKITPAGATFPYGKDPENTNIRLAPSFPTIEQIKLAMEAFTTAVGLASTKKLLGK